MGKTLLVIGGILFIFSLALVAFGGPAGFVAGISIFLGFLGIVGLCSAIYGIGKLLDHLDKKNNNQIMTVNTPDNTLSQLKVQVSNKMDKNERSTKVVLRKTKSANDKYSLKNSLFRRSHSLQNLYRHESEMQNRHKRCSSF